MIQQVMQRQVIKATQINELVNFCNDTEESLDELLEQKLKGITGDVVEEVIQQRVDLQGIYNRLANLEAAVNNLPNLFIQEAANALAQFKLNINLQ